MIKGCIFDLDGVIVDTAKYHYLAWKRLAGSLGIEFTEHDNEQLKGVSRMQSLEHILEIGKLSLSIEDKLQLAKRKNEWYVEYITHIDKSEILDGAEKLLLDLKKNNISIALGSASKNAIPLLKSIGILDLFDYISDGNSTDKSKPDPEVFLIAAKGLNLLPEECVVFEDSIKGVEAAIKGNFKSIGIGEASVLGIADFVWPDLHDATWGKINDMFN